MVFSHGSPYPGKRRIETSRRSSEYVASAARPRSRTGHRHARLGETPGGRPRRGRRPRRHPPPDRPRADGARGMIMPPRLRKLLLTAHILASVGWLGAVVAFL